MTPRRDPNRLFWLCFMAGLCLLAIVSLAESCTG